MTLAGVSFSANPRLLAVVGLLTAIVASIALGTSIHAMGSLDGSHLVANTGVSVYAARRAIDLINSWWGFAAAVALTGGWTAGLLTTAKWLLTRYSAAWVAAW